MKPAPEEIYLRALDGMVSGDARWTTGLLTQLFDRLPELDEEKLRQGMLALQQIGWVTNSAGSNWMPTDAFALGCAHWQLPLARRISARLLNDSVETTDIVLLRMLGSVWLCRQQGKQYTLESTSSSHLLSFLDNVLAGFTVLPQPYSNGISGGKRLRRSTFAPSILPEMRHTTSSRCTLLRSMWECRILTVFNN